MGGTAPLYSTHNGCSRGKKSKPQKEVPLVIGYNKGAQSPSFSPYWQTKGVEKNSPATLKPRGVDFFLVALLSHTFSYDPKPVLTPVTAIRHFV